MGNEVRMGGFQILPPVVKNLLIINVIFFVTKLIFTKLGINLDAWLGLHYFTAKDFHIWQPITYMFVHGDFGHLFFNMFALWMFGAAVENYWGAKRFLIFYFITGIGAGFVHYLVLGLTMHPDIALLDQYIDQPTIDNLQTLISNHKFIPYDAETMDAINSTYREIQMNPGNHLYLNKFADQMVDYKEMYLNMHNIVGASGAIFGLLLAFGMLFPNSEIYLYFLLPIKAKWFVIFYGALELFYGVTGTADGVAHFAHLGGMLFGLILILVWRKMDRERGENYGEWY